MFSALVFSEKWGEERCRQLRTLNSPVALTNLDASIKATAASKDATIAKVSALSLGLVTLIDFKTATMPNSNKNLVFLIFPCQLFTSFMTLKHGVSWYRNYSLVEHHLHLENFRVLTD